MDQITVDTIVLLLIQCLKALTDRHYCQHCLSTIQYKLNPFYWPHKPLEYGLEKYFSTDSLKMKLFENMLRTIHDCRFYLEEVVARLQEVPQDMIYHNLHDSCIQVLLELRFGIFRIHVPRIKTFSTLTEYGLQVKTKSIQRFFYPKIKDLLRKLASCQQIYGNLMPCVHEKSQIPKIPLKVETDKCGPLYPSSSKYHICKICVSNGSKTCLH